MGSYVALGPGTGDWDGVLRGLGLGTGDWDGVLRGPRTGDWGLGWGPTGPYKDQGLGWGPTWPWTVDWDGVLWGPIRTGLRKLSLAGGSLHISFTYLPLLLFAHSPEL
ncbi:hypothetical protein NHX12_030357 [Muraenolepis orangiensis]|uniref:Uncharacterized protein n=1 Tax=Muraenolepis orangiensis TaxID=630683 RepID=A0A9Q0ILR1_9TELE|nr:hypothetical protein NHX12_030357 [Muraenolepis orangiensis]